MINPQPTKGITVPMLKKGMIVHYYGGRFLVTEDARASQSHFPKDGIGPTDCAIAKSVCLSGHVQGYFKEGTFWPFQGNYNAVVHVEI